MADRSELPDPPAQLKAIQVFMRMAKDIDRVDPIVGYWLRLYSTETALKIDKDSKESKTFLVALLSWLEKFKQSHKEDEAVTNQTVGQAHYENFVMALFNRVDTMDRNGTFDKNTVRMFFMASVLFEAMAVFGPLTDEVSAKSKYAKFKAAYIQKCFKAGQTPKPGPFEGSDLDSAAPSATDPTTGGSLPPASSSAPSTHPQMPMPTPGAGILDSGGPTVGRGVLDIPEVPKDSFDNSVSPSAIVPPKPTDPFILTPSVPPSSIKPKQPIQAPTMPSASDQNRSTIADARFLATNGTPLKPEDILKGQKYCKFANSALQYDDIPTAVANLQKALRLLTTGQNPDE